MLELDSFEIARTNQKKNCLDYGTVWGKCVDYNLVGCPNFDVTTGKILAIILAHDSKFSGLTKYFAAQGSFRSVMTEN